MVFNRYASAVPFFEPGAAPAYAITDEDKQRIQSYDLYTRIYWSAPQTFKLTQRGLDSSPIYLPSARKIIEACNRYLAVNFDILVENDQGGVMAALFGSMFKRERFYTKFKTQKRYSLIRADALWHVVGDPDKAEGSRISVYELDPSNYFPIMDPENPEKRIGCHLVDVITHPDDDKKKVARVQTYRKEETGRISSSLGLFEIPAWDDRNLLPKDIKLIKWEKPKFDLPPEITALPVYHLPNNRLPGPSPFGISEIMGIERAFAAVNQAVSDEELALAMAGLGVYWTTAGPPRDAANNIVPWDIGPARMLEIAQGTAIGRLAGIDSVQPMIDHMKFILGEVQSGLGVPDIAAGRVDVQIAESGISLALQLSPLLAKNSEQEEVIIEVHDQMFYDLVHGWYPAYEGTPAETDTSVVAVVGDPMPKNRKADIDEVTSLVAARILSIKEARIELRNRFGYEISAEVDELLAEASSLANATDPFAGRAARELEDEDSGGAGQENDRNGQVHPVIAVST